MACTLRHSLLWNRERSAHCAELVVLSCLTWHGFNLQHEGVICLGESLPQAINKRAINKKQVTLFLNDSTVLKNGQSPIASVSVKSDLWHYVTVPSKGRRTALYKLNIHK